MKMEGEMLESVLWRSHEIQARVAELGRAISDDFDGRPVVILGVATGAFMFLADLVRHIALPLQVDFVRVQSYGNDTKSSGAATITTDCKVNLQDKHIIVVEDIIDTGITLAKLVSHLGSKGAASVSVCVLLDKVSRRVVPLKLSGLGKSYVGFECPDYFVVGYGMDYAERFRSLPCIGVLKPEVYQQAS
jgi:hypoxanthine phosphoribosyltransferase